MRANHCPAFPQTMCHVILHKMAVMAALVFGVQFLMPTAFGQVQWVKDIEQAKELARRQHRLVLLHFWGDHCPPCEKMEQKVFPRPEVGRAISSRYIPVKVHVQSMPNLRDQYRVTGWPTDVIITPDGREVRRAIGYREPHKYLALLDETAARFSTTNEALANAPAGESVGQNGAGAQPSVPFQTVQYNQNLGGPGGNGVPRNGPPDNNGVAFGGRPQQNGQFQPPGGAQNRTGSPFGGRSPTPQNNQFQPPTQGPNNRSRWSPTQNSPSPNTPGGGGLTPGGGSFKPPSSASAQGSETRGASPQPNTGGRFQPGSTRSAWPPKTSAGAMAGPPTGNPSSRGAPQYRVSQNGVPQDNPFARKSPPGPSGRSAQSPQLGQSGAARRNQQTAGGGASTASPAHPTIGLEGYCPVTLIERKQWNPGDARFGAIHRGRTYLFAGPEEQRRFLDNPDRYGPVLCGYDPVVFLEQRRLVEGNRKFGVFLSGQIYLFADSTSRERFERNPRNFAAGAYQAMLDGAAERKLR